MNNAVAMVKNQSMSLRQAANAYSIPKSTLSNKVLGKTSIECKSGPATVLSKAEENQLADWLVNMAKMGFGRTKNELLDTVKRIIEKDGRPNPFTNNRPGKDWYYAFLKRHPELSSRAPQQLAKERAVIMPKKVEQWFRDFSDFMAEENEDQSVWKDPTRWFNADESGFPLCPKSWKVLAPKGLPNIYNFTSSDKTQVTVLACMNAAGLYLRPYVIFPGQRFTYNPLQGFPEAILGHSASGWMESELFLTWLKDVFSPALDENGIKRPVVLFVDGHSTHATLEASKFCRENNIILYCLLEHASHLMQPCDLKLFSALKESWKQSVRDFQIANVGEFVTKAKFAGVFKSAWVRTCSLEIAIKGFRDSGLYPLDPRKVLGTLKMEPSKIFGVGNSREINEKSTEINDREEKRCEGKNDNNENEKSNEINDREEKRCEGKNDNNENQNNESETNKITKDNENDDKQEKQDKNIENQSETESIHENTDSQKQHENTNRQECDETNKSNDLLNDSCKSPIVGCENPGVHDTKDCEISPSQSTPKSSLLLPTVSPKEGQMSKENYVSPVLAEVLMVPKANRSTSKQSKKRLMLPKAISGEKFHNLLEERKRKKEEEIRQKEERKRVREEKRAQKLKDLEIKRKEREENKQLKLQKKLEKEKQKKIQAIERELKRKHESDSDTDVSDDITLEDDELVDIDLNIKRACYACEMPFDNKTGEWIFCQKCGRWLHRACVKTIDLLSLSEGQIADLQFECDYC